jgi:hypothetical protein
VVTVVAKMRNTFLLRLKHSQRQFQAAAARCCVAHHQFHLPVAVEAAVVDDWHRRDSSSAPLGFVVRDSEFSSFSFLRSVSCASRGFAAMAEPVKTPLPTQQQQGVSSSRAAEAESEVAEVGGDRREEARSAAGAPEESAAAAAGVDEEAGEEVAAAPRRYAVLTTGNQLKE